MNDAPTASAAAGEPALISVLMPTRGRPAAVVRMLSTLFSLAERPDRVEAVLRIDDDDAATLALDFAATPELAGANVRRLVGPRLPMAELNTACLEAAGGDILFAANDDVAVRTQGWDARLRAAVARHPDGVYLAFPNDLLQGNRLATFPCLSREACRLLGEPYPKAFRGEFIDVHLMDIFQRLKGVGVDRVLYLEDVVFEHLHHRAAKSVEDATYRERLNTVDDHVYLALQDERRAAARRLARRVAGETPPDAAPPRPAPAGSFAWRSFKSLAFSTAPFLWRLRVFSWLWRRRVAVWRSGRPA